MTYEMIRNQENMLAVTNSLYIWLNVQKVIKALKKLTYSLKKLIHLHIYFWM